MKKVNTCYGELYTRCMHDQHVYFQRQVMCNTLGFTENLQPY